MHVVVYDIVAVEALRRQERQVVPRTYREQAGEEPADRVLVGDACREAALQRLRPILMTALTMIIGLFPLIVATGAGANGNRSLGVGTVGGMLVGTVALLFVVPVLFTVFQAIEERVMPRRQTDAAE